MADWLERLLGKQKHSADSAKDRLKLVLINDRTNLTTEQVEALKNDLLQVISRYVDIDPTAVQISISQEGRENRLVADIPIRTPARRKRSPA